MDTLGRIRLLWTPRIKKRRSSHALLVSLPIDECHLGYVMHLPHFRGACWPFLHIWWRKVSRYSWTTSWYLDPYLNVAWRTWKCATKMHGSKPSSKIGEVPFHGSRRHSLGPQNFGLRDWGRSSQDWCHWEVATIIKCQRHLELPRTCRVL